MFCSSSGLSAAKLLKANGLNPVVLEARNRVGGRTFTVRVRLRPFFYNCLVRPRYFHTNIQIYSLEQALEKIALNARDMKEII